MKKYFILFLIPILFSCKSKNEEPELDNKTYQKIKHKVKYIDIKQKNGLIKHIGFYPNTKDTFSIFFTNAHGEMKNYSKLFYKTGDIMSYVKYVDNMRLCKNFYKNGNLEETFILDKNNIKHGVEKQFYKTGELKAILEYIVYKDSVEYLNRQRLYFKNGELNKDSTLFLEILLDQDTISINDSTKINIDGSIPSKTQTYAYFGAIDTCYNNTDYSKVRFLQEFYFKPKHLGYDTINIVFDIVTLPKQKNTEVFKMFLKKQIYVTK